MNQSIFTAIDIGSELIKIISVNYDFESDKIKIIHKTSTPSSGFSQGYVNNSVELSKSLKQSILQHQRESKVKIESAFFSIGGIGIKSKIVKIPHAVAGHEITNFDINKIKEKAENFIEKKIPGCVLESQPIKYIINDFEHFSSPIGMETKKLYTDYFFLFIPKNHLTSLENVIENNNIVPLEIMPSILHASIVSTNEEDRNLGCILIDIGAETTDILVYKNNVPLCVGSIPLGSKDITREISIKLKIDFFEAEEYKKKEKFDKSTKIAVDKKLREIAKEIKKYLNENLEHNTKFLSGIIFIGGGSKIKGIQKIFRQVLSLSVKRGRKNIISKETDFSTAYGIVIAGITKEKENSAFSFSELFSNIQNIFKKILRKISI